ncbi:hypothetical protein F8388_005860 [Cannabis sativa]|uniref:Transposase-associated domain-containing protein n=1 Tax=Cannabis sativa TaxID=3483 RepID=A0A7J6HG06_CANSA|nr:hypothetical protein F8388_005860 [Cannabis sativa]
MVDHHLRLHWTNMKEMLHVMECYNITKLKSLVKDISFEMDRDWMSANRLTVKYREGVDFFLEFSAKNADNPDLVHCPCLKCGNMERMKIAQIREHLFKNGTLTMDDPGDYDDDFALWGQSIGGESESDPAAPELEPDPDSQPKKKNGRGAYKGLKHIKNRSEGILLEVEYNQWGQNLIFKYKDKVPAMLDRPPDAYASCYKPEDWKEFVAKRCSPEWAKKRKKMQDIRSQNTYNHHAGRGGVKKVEEKLEKELGHQLTIYDRADLWIRIHTNKNGELDGPAQEVADRIYPRKASAILIGSFTLVRGQNTVLPPSSFDTCMENFRIFITLLYPSSFWCKVELRGSAVYYYGVLLAQPLL